MTFINYIELNKHLLIQNWQPYEHRKLESIKDLGAVLHFSVTLRPAGRDGSISVLPTKFTGPKFWIMHQPSRFNIPITTVQLPQDQLLQAMEMVSTESRERIWIDDTE